MSGSNRKKDPRFHLRFDQQQVNTSQRRHRSLTHQEEGHNLRAAIEATIHQVKHPYPASKLPVRGRFRVTCMLIGCALVSNVRRIRCYLETKKNRENGQMKTLEEQESSREQPLISFFVSLKTIFIGCMALLTNQQVEFGY